MSDSRFEVGVIGLGNMGAPMAQNLAKVGYLRALWNRTRTRGTAVAQKTGVFLEENVQSLAARCDVILLSLTEDKDVLEIVDAILPALRAGTIVIDTSTVSPDTARAAAAKLARVGAEFLDAPVSGGVEGARKATLVMMVGGDANAFARAKPLFGAISARAEHMGPVGSGQATKAVNQVMVAGINQAVTEALAFGEALGLPMEKVVDVLSGGAGDSWHLRHRGATMLRGDFAPGFKMALHQKDLFLCKSLAEARKAQLPLVEMTLIHYRRMIAEGYGEQDISALFRQKQRLFTEGKA